MTLREQTTLREQKKSEQRRRILDACAELFRNRGFDETTVDQILEAVAISRQTFFNYFRSKEAVLRELGFEWMGREARLAIERAQSAAGGSLLGRLKKLLRTQFRALERDRDFMRLVFTRSGLFFPQSDQMNQTEARERLDRTRGYFEIIAAGVRAAQDNGEIRKDVDPYQVAEIYTAIFYVTTRLSLTDYWGKKQRLDTRMLRAVEILMQGLAPPAATKTGTAKRGGSR